MDISLHPGDCLVYRPTGWIGWAIATKTFHNWSHVEGVCQPGSTNVASRDGLGVNLYPMRWEQLGMVLRPRPGFDFEKAMAYFATVRGQKYDLAGLFAFFRMGTGNGDRQFCSEFLTNWVRAGGIEPFHGEDARIVPPYYFAKLADGLDVVWSDGKP